MSATSRLNDALSQFLLQDKIQWQDVAVDENTRLLKLQPDDFRAYFNRGLAVMALEGYKGAIADYDRAMALAPSAES